MAGAFLYFQFIKGSFGSLELVLVEVEVDVGVEVEVKLGF